MYTCIYAGYNTIRSPLLLAGLRVLDIAQSLDPSLTKPLI